MTRLVLELVEGPRSLPTHLDLSEGTRIRLGSAPRAELCLPGEEAGVSPEHAFLEFIGKGLFVVAEPGQSLELNGKKVASGQLKPGMTLRVGKVLLRLIEEEEAPVSELSAVSISILEELEEAKRPEVSSPPPLVRPRVWYHFELLELLGKGGFGAVYRARHQPTAEICALKLIHPSSLERKDGLRRFLREQELVSTLRHPGIIRFFEAGEAEGLPYLAAEYVGGGTLEKLTPCKSRPQFYTLAIELFETLAYMHEHRAVHRDIKPANILLTEPDAEGLRHPKLADLGFAKNFDGLLKTAAMPSLTQSGTVGGTLHWSSPEQVQNFKAFLPSADLYSVSAALYYLLTGRSHIRSEKPFSELTLVKQYELVVKGERIPIRDRIPDLPSRVAGALDGMLSLDGDFRSRSSAKNLADRFTAGRLES